MRLPCRVCQGPPLRPAMRRRRQNLQVRARAEGAAPGLSASENLAGTDGGKRAPVAGKRPDTVLPVLNPQVAESAGRVSPKKRMADAAADFTRRLAADRRRKRRVCLWGAANTVSSIRTAGILMRLRVCRAGGQRRDAGGVCRYGRSFQL